MAENISQKKCPVCGSGMNIMSRSPDVWLCPKCGFKLVSD